MLHSLDRPNEIGPNVGGSMPVTKNPTAFFVALTTVFLMLMAFAPSAAAQNTAESAAVRDVILKFNQASADATAARDPSLIRPYVTEDLYRQMTFEMQASFSQGL